MDTQCNCKKAICNRCNQSSSCRCGCFKLNPRRSRRNTNGVRSYGEMVDADPGPIPAPVHVACSTTMPITANIRKAFHMTMNDLKNLPKENSRKNLKFDLHNATAQRRVIHIARKAMQNFYQAIYPSDPNRMLQEVGSEVSKKETTSDDKKPKKNTKKLIRAMPETSVLRKKLKTTVSNSYTNEVLSDEHAMSRWKATTSRRNFQFIVLKKQELKVAKGSARKYDSNVVEKAAEIFLNDANVQRISWGMHEVKIDLLD